MQHQLVGVVAKVHVVQHHFALQAGIGDCAVRLVGMLPSPHVGALFALHQVSVPVLLGVYQGDVALVGLGLFVNQVKDTLGAGHAHDNHIQLVGNLADVAGKLLGHVQKRHHNADAKGHAGKAQVGGACHHHNARDNGHAHIQHIADVVQDGHKHVGVDVGLLGVVEQLVVDLVEVLLGLLFVAEHLDNLLAVHHLFHHTLCSGNGLLHADEILGRAAAHLFGDQHHKEHAHQHHQGHPHAEIEHDGKHSKHRHGGDDKLGDALGNHLAQCVDIVGVIAHHVAMVVGVKILDGQILHAVEHLFAHLGKRALGDDGHQLVEHRACRQAEHIEHHQDEHKTENLSAYSGPVPRLPALLHQGDDVLHKDGRDRTDNGVKQDAGQGHREHHRIEAEQHLDKAHQNGGAIDSGIFLLIHFRHLPFPGNLCGSARCKSRGKPGWWPSAPHGCQWRQSRRYSSK